MVLRGLELVIIGEQIQGLTTKLLLGILFGNLLLSSLMHAYKDALPIAIVNF